MKTIILITLFTIAVSFAKAQAPTTPTIRILVNWDKASRAKFTTDTLKLYKKH